MKHDRPRIIDIIARQLGRDAGALVAGFDLPFADLGIDALDRIELVCALEERLGIAIPDAALDHFLTVGDLVRYLERPILVVVPLPTAARFPNG